MYVPDRAYDHEDDISPAAGRLYRYFCKWRDHETRLSRKGFERARADLADSLARATAYRAYKELLDRRWIKEMPDGRVMPLFGSFACVNKLGDAEWREWLRGRYPAKTQGKTASLKIETGQISSLNFETENLTSETESLKIETAHIKDRARGSSSNSSSITSSKTHTHDLESQPARARAEVPPGVCVSSEFSKADVKRYGRNQTPPLGKGWVTKALRTGEWDDDIRDWLRSHPANGNGHAAPAARCDHSCALCGGSGWANTDGKGVRPCANKGRPAAMAHAPP